MTETSVGLIQGLGQDGEFIYTLESVQLSGDIKVYVFTVPSIEKVFSSLLY